MLGKYENFPVNIHLLETFTSQLNTKQLQQKLILTLKEMNRKPFRFEEIAIPTIPDCEILFEFGIAEGEGFNFLNDEETKKALEILKSEQVPSLDFFCAIRYYKICAEKKTALKFDYYMLKTGFAAKKAEFQVFHKQGPRYISPEDLVNIITDKINKTSVKRVLKKIEPENSQF
jgi:hypothetical protein